MVNQHLDDEAVKNQFLANPTPVDTKCNDTRHATKYRISSLRAIQYPQLGMLSARK
jgi:hypothetical protein